MPRGCACLGFYVCDLDFGFSTTLCLFIYLVSSIKESSRSYFDLRTLRSVSVLKNSDGVPALTSALILRFPGSCLFVPPFGSAEYRNWRLPQQLTGGVDAEARTDRTLRAPLRSPRSAQQWAAGRAQRRGLRWTRWISPSTVVTHPQSTAWLYQRMQ